jgi:hypothetical protein
MNTARYTSDGIWRVPLPFRNPNSALRIRYGFRIPRSEFGEANYQSLTPPTDPTDGSQAGDLPEAERAVKEVLSLPIFPEMTDEQMIRVTNTLKEAMRRSGEASR